jgi:predicted phosphodiesterase
MRVNKGNLNPKVLAYSCTHIPRQDDQAVAWLLRRISDEQPDVIVHLGDLVEAEAASKFKHSGVTWDLLNEYEQADEHFLNVYEAYPPARRVFLKGNHDANISDIGRIDSALWRLADPKLNMKRWSLFEHPAEYVFDKFRGTFKLGQITFAHGWSTAVNANKIHALELSEPYGLYVGGHTHRPERVAQVHATQTLPLPYWAANVGTLRDIVDVHWMERKRRSRWGQAIFIGEVDTSWTFLDGMMPSTRRWSGDVEVYRTYYDIIEKEQHALQEADRS